MQVRQQRNDQQLGAGAWQRGVVLEQVEAMAKDMDLIIDQRQIINQLMKEDKGDHIKKCKTVTIPCYTR